MKYEFNLLQMHPIGLEDVYSIFTRIIPLHVHNLYRPIVNENLHSALVSLWYGHDAFPQGENTG